jgi:hypothetical protein
MAIMLEHKAYSLLKCIQEALNDSIVSLGFQHSSFRKLEVSNHMFEINVYRKLRLTKTTTSSWTETLLSFCLIFQKRISIVLLVMPNKD